MPAYKNWIQSIDIEIDYYSAFIKSWIAFNSWYREKYGAGSESSVLDKIKSSENEFKTHMKNLISSETAEALEFKSRIGKLHTALNDAALFSQERAGTKTQISFTTIAVTNGSNNVHETYRYNKYAISRAGNSFEIRITHKDTNVEIFKHSQTSYSKSELENCARFMQLSSECKGKCLALYSDVSPYTIKSVLRTEPTESEKRTQNFNQFEGIYFVDDKDEICVGIIDVLYLLRCTLMHGDIQPSESALNVYEHSYYILKTVLRKML